MTNKIKVFKKIIPLALNKLPRFKCSDSYQYIDDLKNSKYIIFYQREIQYCWAVEINKYWLDLPMLLCELYGSGFINLTQFASNYLEFINNVKINNAQYYFSIPTKKLNTIFDIIKHENKYNG